MKRASTFLVLSFDGVRGWSKDGVAASPPKSFSEREKGSGVFSGESEDLLFVEVVGDEPEYVGDEA